MVKEDAQSIAPVGRGRAVAGVASLTGWMPMVPTRKPPASIAEKRNAVANLVLPLFNGHLGLSSARLGWVLAMLASGTSHFPGGDQ
jgi:hypothetical protein